MGRLRTNSFLFPGGRCLLCVLCVQIAFTLAIVLTRGSGHLGTADPAAVDGVLGTVAGVLILMAVYTASRGIRAQYQERTRARGITDLMDTVLNTRREWWWAVDAKENFTFSSSACISLLGYDPSELIGRPVSLVMEPDELAKARRSIAAALDPDRSGWAGVTISCRHSNGAPVRVEVSGQARPAGNGQGPGFEGTCRPLQPETVQALAAKRSTSRIQAILRHKTILTAFQPIHELGTGDVIGVEALTRFPDDESRSPDHLFNEATAVGLGTDLEFAALESALTAAGQLPNHLYVALNLSPSTCLDPRLPGFLEQSGIPVDRLVLELTEHLAVDEYTPLIAALAPLRQRGLLIAIDDAGSGFASMRHILHLRPDIIKLDRSLITGIDDDPGQRALGAAMVEFAKQIDARLVAEGIETHAELTAVTRLRMSAGQGYFLGRPSIHLRQWATWRIQPMDAPA